MTSTWGHRKVLLNWLEANDLDPNRIPVDSGCAVDNDAQTITVDVFAVQDGQLVRGKDGFAVRQTVTVPLKVAWHDRKRGPDA